MKNLQTILVRFRRNSEGAQGDIAIMFYQVRVCKQDQMMRFKEEKKVRTFCMNRHITDRKAAETGFAWTIPRKLNEVNLPLSLESRDHNNIEKQEDDNNVDGKYTKCHDRCKQFGCSCSTTGTTYYSKDAGECI